MRIPLQHRTKESNRTESFILNDSVRKPRLSGTFASQERKKRKVSDWAKAKNLSYFKAREDMLAREARALVEKEKHELQGTDDQRRSSKSFIERAMDSPLSEMNLRPASVMAKNKPKQRSFFANSPLLTPADHTMPKLADSVSGTEE